MGTEGIHATAIVAATARLGAGTRVGAWSVVGPEVEAGEGVEVGNHVTLEGPVVLGPGVRVGHGSVLGGLPQDLKYRPGTVSGVRIGARTVIREHVIIHRATTAGGWTEIGADCLIMATSHVAHDCRLGDGVIVINYAGITGHCEIGERATIGGLTGLAPFTRVGAYAYVGGCSKVTADVPPFMLVDGNPAVVHAVNVVGLRRAGVPAEERRRLQDAYRILYRRGLPPGRALDQLRQELEPGPWVTRLIEFVVATRRGICGPAHGRAAGIAPEAEEDELEG